jgi:hypothetical protein
MAHHGKPSSISLVDLTQIIIDSNPEGLVPILVLKLGSHSTINRTSLSPKISRNGYVIS